jgi:carboxypeptidase family protein/TonB-dependent receptor-like protein
MLMSRRSFATLGRWSLLGLVFLVVTAPAAMAQTSTGSIRGYVTDSSGAPIAGARVVAVNPLTTAQREVATQSNGFYALLGLVPAEYDVAARQIGMAPQKIRVRVLIGEVFPLDFKLAATAVQLEAVTVAAAATGVEMRTSEVATNVSQQQIERLPTASRNFLDLAALAPGVTISDDRINSVSRTFSAGGQTANTVNVFVDGTSLKNDLTGGGVTGQDASKGNPFPRAAIQEYRVISQNFKAEYQKASSAIITATTKSGGNEWHGNALYGYQNKDLVALDTFQIAAKNANPATFQQPDYSRSLVSLSLGGPIQRDKLFFFGSYEGNYQNRSNLVNFPTPAAGFPDLDTVNITKYNGNFGSPFHETMVFGKLNYTADPKSSLELSFSTRHETDVRDFANVNCPENMCAFNEAVNFRQDITIGQLRYNRFAGAWLNEAKVDYSRFRRNPTPNAPGLPARVYSYRDAAFGNKTNNYIGSNLSIQDFTQKRLGFRDDLTHSSGGQHVIKMGASLDFVMYDVFKGNDETPRFAYADSINGHSYKFRNPYELRYGTGNAALNKDNQEIGAYVQDDWSPTPRLTINVGIRWDFESKMMNYDYVTPQMVVDTLTRYHDSLPTNLDLNRYISTGNNRKPFYGAFQPRIGFSYGLDEDNKTTAFGGFGIYYDRTLFDVSVDETLKLTHPTYTITFADSGRAPGPGEVAWNNSYLTADKATLDALVHTQGVPEAWLIDKDVKVPKSYQWNVGLRRLFGSVLVSAAYAGVRGVDQLALNWAQFALKPDGSCCVSFNLAAHGFSNFIYSTNDAKTWYDALQVTVDRSYRRSTENFGWGAGLALTYATRSVQGQDNLGDLFDFPNTIGIPKHPANDEKTRVVANWIMDVPYLAGVQFSGLITLGSGAHKDVGGPPRFNPGATYIRGGFTPPQYSFIVPNAWAYRTVDLRLRKDFPNISGTTLGVTLDVFNVFNYSNFDYDNFLGPNPKPRSTLLSDPRRAQLGLEYNF